MELRRYEERDRAAVWRLHVEGLRETGTDAGDGPWDDDLRAIGAAYLMAGGEFLVGVLDGDVVAIGGLQRLSPHVAEVKRLRVD